MSRRETYVYIKNLTPDPPKKMIERECDIERDRDRVRERQREGGVKE